MTKTEISLIIELTFYWEDEVHKEGNYKIN